MSYLSLLHTHRQTDRQTDRHIDKLLISKICIFVYMLCRIWIPGEYSNSADQFAEFGNSPSEL